MRVYLPGSTGRKVVMVAPGALVESSEFMDEKGQPRTFEVSFVNGRSEDISEHLGRFMIDTGAAKRSPLILPAGVAA